VLEPVKKTVASIESLSKKVGDKYRFILPGGASVDVPEGSFESDILIALANNDTAIMNKPYVLERVYFDSGSSDLSDGSRLQITGLAAILNAYPELKIHLRGHTDNRGSADGNLAISTQRAQAVKSSLMHLAVEQNRISIQGMGPIEPIADNTSEEGRAKNRRIDLSIIN
jgi:K(+)-stimulated pyrophosphate-energized sodium pump